jgi:uncharacterized membrane protein
VGHIIAECTSERALVSLVSLVSRSRYIGYVVVIRSRGWIIRIGVLRIVLVGVLIVVGVVIVAHIDRVGDICE